MSTTCFILSNRQVAESCREACLGLGSSSETSWQFCARARSSCSTLRYRGMCRAMSSTESLRRYEDRAGNRQDCCSRSWMQEGNCGGTGLVGVSLSSSELSVVTTPPGLMYEDNTCRVSDKPIIYQGVQRSENTTFSYNSFIFPGIFC